MYRFYTWAIDIDDLPINSGDFPLRYVKNQQRISTIGSRLHRYTLVFCGSLSICTHHFLVLSRE